MIKVRNLERQQENLVALIAFAQKHGGTPILDLLDYESSGPAGELVDLFTKGSNGPLTRPELTHLTDLVQLFLRLPVYTTTQASAFLGEGIDTIRDAVWRNKTLKTMKPGHDVLVTHGELQRFLDNGN